MVNSRLLRVLGACLASPTESIVLAVRDEVIDDMSSGLKLLLINLSLARR